MDTTADHQSDRAGEPEATSSAGSDDSTQNVTDGHPRSRSRLSESTRKILADADQRDERATRRDAVSDERARVADREAFTGVDGEYSGHGERRAAALDRADSRSDREASADDRTHFIDDMSAAEGRIAARDRHDPDPGDSAR